MCDIWSEFLIHIVKLYLPFAIFRRKKALTLKVLIAFVTKQLNESNGIDQHHKFGRVAEEKQQMWKAIRNGEVKCLDCEIFAFVFLNEMCDFVDFIEHYTEREML